jgi:ribosomal RNA-processing protein 9
LSGSNDGSLALWHMSKKKPLNIKQMAHYDEASKQATWITSVAALHNTDLIASGSNDGLLRIWRCSDDFFKIEHLFNVKLHGFINDLKFSADGKYIVAAIGQEHKYGRWSTVKDCRNSVVIVKLNKTEI